MSKLNRQQQAAPTGSKIIDWLRTIDHVARRGATEKEIEILGEAMLITLKYMENPVEYQNVSTYGWYAKEIKNSAIHCIFGGYTIDLPTPSLLPCPRKHG